MTYIFEVKGLNVWFKEKHVLKDVWLKIPEKCIFTIIGPSGSGKSTLLKTLNRLIEIYDGVRIVGEVLFKGIDVFSMDPSDLRRKAVMVLQVPSPFPHMSIYDNIAYPVKALGIAKSKRDIDNIVKEVLIKVRLWDEVKDRLKIPASRLSGGQQQRLAIARALALRPEALLMDEPTSMIDVYNTRRIEELMKELSKDMTIIVVTHDLAQARRIADYIAFIYDGKIVEYGSARDVLESPRSELTKAFISGALPG